MLNSDAAIEINISIVRAFVAIRKMIVVSPVTLRLSNLEKNFEELKQDLEEIFSDYNDINENTRLQLDAINTALADLQSEVKTRKASRPKIGFKTED